MISYDATHHSSAQAKFSFSKADRFPKVRGADGNQQIGYSLPSQLEQRSAGIGFGQRTVFAKADSE